MTVPTQEGLGSFVKCFLDLAVSLEDLCNSYYVLHAAIGIAGNSLRFALAVADVREKGACVDDDRTDCTPSYLLMLQRPERGCLRMMHARRW